MNEQQYLISLFIGPVQDFIAAALRTRDLWFGSFLLSEVSKAAAKAMLRTNVQLIFPATDNAAELEPGPQRNVANRILALVNGDRHKAEEVLKAGKHGARHKMREFLAEAKKRACKVVDLNETIWDKQADPKDILELYATAVPVPGDGFRAARKRLDHLTMARKNSREFFQSAPSPGEDGFGLPKSSLDGCRETVLEKMAGAKGKLARRRLRMGENEQLDAVGLVKRLAWGQDADQFTPTTRLAIDPWIRKIKSGSAPDTLDKLAEEFDKLADIESPLLTRVRGNREIYADMPYDAGLLYPGPLGAARRDSENKPERDILKELLRYMVPVWKEHGRPCPYYALILADGDHMGDFLDRANNHGELRKISGQLSEFAGLVPDITRKFRGHVIYAGGDDLLLMAPPDGALELADALRCMFSDTMQQEARKLVPDGHTEDTPTLSVGLVLAHMQTPVGRVRRLAGEAERLAKGNDSDAPRNALGIIVAPRSGAELSIRIKWEGESFPRFRKLVKLYREELLPTRFAYALRTLELELPAAQDVIELEEIKRLELERILTRKQQGGGEKNVSPEAVRTVLEHAGDRRLAEIFPEHLAARWLGVHRGGE